MHLRRAFFIAAVIALMTLVPAQAAQSPSASQSTAKPTLTIARFQGAPHSPNAVDPGADLADAIAVLVEESGCCRVMPREWLPADKSTSSPAPAKLRDAAAVAGVEYVVIGNIMQSHTQRPALPVIPALVSRMRPSPYGLSGRPATPYVSVSVSTLVTVEVRVLAASSGEVVRTLRMDRTVTSQPHPIGPAPQAAPAPGAIGAALPASASQLKGLANDPLMRGSMTTAPQKSDLGRLLASIAPDLAGALMRAVGQLGQGQKPIGGLKPADF
jgi:hypothetical protein